MTFAQILQWFSENAVLVVSVVLGIGGLLLFLFGIFGNPEKRTSLEVLGRKLFSIPPVEEKYKYILIVVGVIMVVVGLVLFFRQVDGGPPPDKPPTEGPTPTHTPTPTFTPTVTATWTPTPTFTPTVTPTPTPIPLVIDDFEGYGSDEALRDIYGINAAWGRNVGQLSLASPPNVGEGSRAVAFYYEIKTPKPHDYAGFERHIVSQNWRDYGYLRVWVRSDGSDKDLIIQFCEASGEGWRRLVNLSTFGEEDFKLRLDESTFEWADWSEPGNGRIDLDAIDYYGFFVGGGLGEGTIYVDYVRVSK